jgi:hypothetical protein
MLCLWAERYPGDLWSIEVQHNDTNRPNLTSAMRPSLEPLVSFTSSTHSDYLRSFRLWLMFDFSLVAVVIYLLCLVSRCQLTCQVGNLLPQYHE